MEYVRWSELVGTNMVEIVTRRVDGWLSMKKGCGCMFGPLGLVFVCQLYRCEYLGCGTLIGYFVSLCGLCQASW